MVKLMAKPIEQYNTMIKLHFKTYLTIKSNG